VFALSVLIAVPAFWILAADPAGELGLIGFLFIFPGVPVTAWAALQTTWRPDERAGYMLATLLRGVLVPAVTVPPLTIVHVILTRIPVLHDRVLAHQRPDAYLRHYWFSGESGAINVIDGSLAETIFMSLLGGFAFSLIAALVISVFVVWPVNAVRNPTALFRDAMLSDDPAVAATNIVAVRALSGVMMLAFVVPTLMVLSDSDEPLWWVGAALIPVLVWLVYLVWKRQRVDHVRRAKYGMAAAVPNPADPPPDHRSTLRTRRTVDQLSAPAGPPTHSRRSAWSTSASVLPPPHPPPPPPPPRRPPPPPPRPPPPAARRARAPPPPPPPPPPGNAAARRAPRRVSTDPALLARWLPSTILHRARGTSGAAERPCIARSPETGQQNPVRRCEGSLRAIWRRSRRSTVG